MFDMEAVKRYHKRMDQRLKERGVSLDGVHRFDINDKHDKLGRFAPKGGGSSKSAEEMTKADVKVSGPKDAKKHIESYMKDHPEAVKQIKADAKKYSDALERVKNFQKEHPDAEDGTYNIKTGKLENPTDGYCLTFHQNNKIGDELGGYDDETYAMMAAITKHELGSDDVYIGFFGNPEISFNCKDYQHAKKFCVEHNQYSIYDAKMGREWVNDLWDEETNPIKGRGSN